MRMTVKGQVTIPKHVRDALGIEPGDEVEFVLEQDSARMTRARRKTGAEIVAHMRGKAQIKMTTDEVMRLMRGDDYGTVA
jgi:AbrB family looped-hinge helix DNA binding protein